ncbi:hypothetical protein BKA64DRAFT_71595 [Cadophora sp. MPI-SDFR-AT-0126]|nr:hypothetical protein BKA64DRAFT_71595 [Leotiomycetes sp. MPI-SDFR-AT-0126]
MFGLAVRPTPHRQLKFQAFPFPSHRRWPGQQALHNLIFDFTSSQTRNPEQYQESSQRRKSHRATMEALAALSVAAAVIQFLDFSSKLVSKGQQLHSSTNGALIENTELEEAARRLKGLTEPLQTSEGDEAIAAICKSCKSSTFLVLEGYI